METLRKRHPDWLAAVEESAMTTERPRTPKPRSGIGLVGGIFFLVAIGTSKLTLAYSANMGSIMFGKDLDPKL